MANLFKQILSKFQKPQEIQEMLDTSPKQYTKEELETATYVILDVYRVTLKRNVKTKNTTFSEKNAADTGVFQKDGYRLMELLID